MSSASFYKWWANFGGMDVSMMSEMKALAEENRRLKRMYAEMSMQNDLLRKCLEKVARPPRRKEMAVKAVADRGGSIALTCRAFQISESCSGYERKLSDENAEIADWLEKLTDSRRTWGFGLCVLYLRNVKGFGWNHKRVYRIYCELELNLRSRPKKRLKRDKPDALAVPDTANHTWSMDFMADQLADGRSIRTLNVLDDFNRIIEWRGKPQIIRVDNGPEYISGKLMTWAAKRGIHIQYIQPGKPQQNAYIERYNRTLRHEWLDQNVFGTIEDAQNQVTRWLWTYNNDRPNMGIGGITPVMKLKMVA